jgi:hypothetical protein
MMLFGFKMEPPIGGFIAFLFCLVETINYWLFSQITSTKLSRFHLFWLSGTQTKLKCNTPLDELKELLKPKPDEQTYAKPVDEPKKAGRTSTRIVILRSRIAAHSILDFRH